MQFIKYISVLLVLILCCFYAQADLKYIPLRIELSSQHASYAQNDLIQFDLKFTNKDTKKRGIVLPGTLYKGRKMIYFSFYSVKDNFYTEVAREAREIDMDSLYYNQAHYKYIDSKSSVSVPVFFNDTMNYRKHIQAHHKLPKLAPGEYQVLAWYNPWDEKLLSKAAFNKLDAFDRSTPSDPNKINLPAEGLQSNYFTLTITDQAASRVAWTPTSFCPTNCRLCKSIEKNKWQQVKRIIADQTNYTSKTDIQMTDSSWLQPHRNIAWIGPGPDAILASLPSYSSRRMIFRNAQGYHYFSATWQIGAYFKGRARLASLLPRGNSFIKTSKLDYLKLVRFQPY